MRAEIQVLVRVDPKIKRGLDKIKKLTGKSINYQARIAFERWIETEMPKTLE